MVKMPTIKEIVAFSKSKTFAKTNFFWNTKWNNSRLLGRVSELLKTAQQEYQKSCNEVRFLPFSYWCNYYFCNACSIEQLYGYAIAFRTEYPEELSDNESFLVVICRVLYQTYIGGKAEYLAIQYLHSLHPYARQILTNDYEDRVFCVDIIEYIGSKIVSAYQVKPQSFFSGIEKEKDWAKRALEYNTKGHQKFFEKTGVCSQYLSWYIQEKHLVFNIYPQISFAGFCAKNQSTTTENSPPSE